MEYTINTKDKNFTLVVSDATVAEIKKHLADALAILDAYNHGKDIEDCTDYYTSWEDKDDRLPAIDIVNRQIKYANDCLNFINAIDAAKEIDSIAKKKNGTFRKGAIKEIISEDLCQSWEDSYCYAYHCIRWKVIDDTIAELQFTIGKEAW